MTTIWKYQFDVRSAAAVAMPRGAQILTLQKNLGLPTIWALVDSEAESVERVIVTCGTGQLAPGGLPYIGTWQTDGYVWHAFDGGETELAQDVHGHYLGPTQNERTELK